MTAKPFLKWVGGKTALLSEILSRVPRDTGVYREPFVGGGAAFFALQPTKAALSDGNVELITCYSAVRDDWRAVRDAIEVILAAHAEDPTGTYAGIRACAPETPPARAARLIYLNKTGFNGLYRVNRRGEFNVPIGTNGKKSHPVVYDTANLAACAEALRHTHLESTDFRHQLEAAEKGDFVYCDPPYAPVSATSDFTSYTSDGFTAGDQADLRDAAAAAKSRGVKILISNSDCPAIRQLYSKGWTIETVGVRRNIAARSSARGPTTEVIIS